MDVDDYVALARAEGREDGSGAWTILASEAREKLARYGMASVTDAVLRLIAGCVGWKGSTIWIECGNGELSFLCLVEQPIARSERVVELFDQLPPDSPERDFALALYYLAGRDDAALTLTVWTEGRLYKAYPLAGEPSSPARNLDGTGLGVHLTCALPDRLEVAARSFLAPLSIFIARKQVTAAGEIPIPEGGWFLEYHHRGKPSALGRLEPRPIGAALYERGVRHGWPTNPKSYVVRLRCIASGEDFDGSLYLGQEMPPSGKTKGCLVYPVKRGVLLERLELQMPCPTALIFLPCDACATDLTGSRLLENELEPLRRRALAILCDGLKVCCDHRDTMEVPMPLTDGRLFVAGATSAAVGLGIGALTGGPIGAIWVTMVLVGVGKSFLDQVDTRSRRDEVAQRFEWAIEDIARMD